jgi:hypothetical protein
LYYYTRVVDGCSARESIYGSERARARLITGEPWNGKNHKLLHCSLLADKKKKKKKNKKNENKIKTYSYKIERVCNRYSVGRRKRDNGLKRKQRKTVCSLRRTFSKRKRTAV